MRYIQICAIAFIIFCCIPLSAVSTAKTDKVDDTLSQINKSMMQMSTFSAKFKQVKKFRILSSPMFLEGSIYINRSPFKLAWNIEKPIGYTAIISEDRLLQWDKETDSTKEYKFSDNPMLGMIAKTYNDILLGEFSRIAKECDISIDKPTYTINVTPLPNSNMGKAVSKITFAFNKDFCYLVAISIDEPGGNSTTIDFSDIKLNSVISEKAWIAGNDT